MRGRKVRATASNGSPTRQTRSAAGLTFENTRRIRSPWLGRDGNASTCSRESSLRQETLRPTAGCGLKLVRARCTIRRIAREQRDDEVGRILREARDHRRHLGQVFRAAARTLQRVPSRLMFFARPSDHSGDRKRRSALRKHEPDLGQHQHAAVLDRAHRGVLHAGRERRAPAREVQRDDSRHGRSARKRSGPHQEFVDRARSLAALADRPHDQRLPAAHIAGGEDLGHGRPVVLGVGLDVGARVALDAELLEQSLSARGRRSPSPAAPDRP